MRKKQIFKNEKEREKFTDSRFERGKKVGFPFLFTTMYVRGKTGKERLFPPSFSAFLFRFRYLVTQEDGRTHLFLPLFLAFFYLLLLSWKMGKRRDGSVPSFEIQWGKGGTYIL